MLKSLKFRLYPTKKQELLINHHIDCCRFVYNLALEAKNYAYSSKRKNLTCYDLINQLPDLKKECLWLSSVNSQSLQQAICDMDRAFVSFFNGTGRFPQFKKKSDDNKFRSPSGASIKIIDDKILLPKFIGGIRFVQDREIDGKIKSVTVSRTSTGKYFASILIDAANNNIKITESTGSVVGIDLGLSHFIITSEGVKIDNPKHYQKTLTKLKYLQRQFSKKKKGSANRIKAKRKVALCHEKITNKRKDFLHKLSTELINSHDTICCEDLNIAGMKHNHNLAQSISSASWGEFVRQLKYKADWSGKSLLQIPRFEPSSKLCNVCGQTKSLTLSERDWTCLNCGTYHDRDINAAINIKNYCLKNNGGGFHRQKSVELPVVIRSVEAGR